MNRFTKITFWKKTLVVILAVSLTIPTVFALTPPQPAHADFSSCASAFISAVNTSLGSGTAAAVTSVPVAANGQTFAQAETAGNSLASLVKNCIEEGLALSIGRMLLAEMTQQIVTYIDSGFQGSPAFVGNPSEFFQNVGDQVLANALNSISEGTFGIDLCSPFRAQLLAGLEVNFGVGPINNYNNYYNGCSLAEIVGNVNNAYQSFQNWNAFLAISMNDQYNPYGAFLDTSNAIQAQATQQINVNASELGWGNGFLSQTDCTHNVYDSKGNVTASYSYVAPGGNGPLVSATGVVNGSTPAPTTTPTGAIQIGKNANGKPIYSNPSKDSCTITTPGTTIAGVLQNQLDIPANQLGVASDLDQIFNALFNQLLSTGLGALGLGQGGLVAAGSQSGSWSSIYANSQTGEQSAVNNASSNLGQLSNGLNNAALNNNGISNTGGNTSNATSSNNQNSNNPKNIALNTTVTAYPGSAAGYGPENLTDGNTNMGNINGTGSFSGSLTIPNNQIGSFTIDLGQQVNNIFKIVVYPHNPTQNWNVSPTGIPPTFKVIIEDQNHNPVWDSSANYSPMSTFGSNPYTLTLNQTESGRYIVIQGLQIGSLQLAQVEVYQDPGPTITLNGSQTVQGTSGQPIGTYDVGATATDANGNTVSVTPTYTDQTGTQIDSSTLLQSGQNYIITYTATDSYGVSSSVQRFVQVAGAPSVSL